jgi:hypothetical protein
MRVILLVATNVDFDVTGRRLIISSISLRYWRKSGSIIAQYLSYLQISRKPMIRLGGKYYTSFSLSSSTQENSWAN